MLISEEVRELIIKNLSVAFSIDASLKTKRGIQHMVSIKPNPRIRTEYELVLTSAIAAEKSCPGSGKLFLEMMCGHIIQINDVVCKSKSDIKNHLRSSNYSSEVLHLLLSIVDLSTKNTSVTIKKSQSHSYIEVSEGYNFSLLPQLSMNASLIDHAGVACIDGYVENVAELHHLFTSLAEKQLPCLLFVRGISNEVLHTIKVNNDRKTMLVFPYIVPYDVDSVNVLVDLAVVSGCDVISSTKGQLISSITYEKLGHAYNCQLLDKVVKFNNTYTKKRVAEHVGFIKEKAIDRQEIGDILANRLKSLSSKNIEIGLPDNINYFSTHQQLDEGIRTITSMLRSDYKPVEYAKTFFESFKKHSSNMRPFTLAI